MERQNVVVTHRNGQLATQHRKTVFWFFLTAVVSLAIPAFPAAVASACQTVQDEFVLPSTDDGLPGEGPIRRYDWFRNLWQNRRAQFASEATKLQGSVVFFGDSITQGWGTDFRGEFPGMLLANRGISGDTTRGMLIRLEEDVLSLDPAAVVLLMGTNDLEENATPEVIARNFSLILQRLNQHRADMPVIVSLVFPSSASKKRSSQDIKQLNELYRDAAKEYQQVTVVDTWTMFANPEGDARPKEFPDLLHPNEIGYRKWAAALVPVFESLQLKDVETDSFEPEPGFVSLFNGKDLTGWGFRPTSEEMLTSRARWQKNNPSAPPWPIVREAHDFNGKSRTPDGRYRAVNGRLVVMTPSEGRRIQQLWTTDEFDGDFVLKLEFRATPNADSGVFVRKPQLQCRDYVLAGPYKNLKNYRPQDWNELVVEVTGGVARCICNGEVIEEALKVPSNGPIGLEGDRGQIEYRRIRIRR